ncbi:hypothetical protein ACP6PL_04340 [Dapis sp. BLCC M126]|uniref:hypothetical protein n=1 Tax=Dapis sp. BLCC M126 TaxID=3400189 RepID=UPI003CF73995
MSFVGTKQINSVDELEELLTQNYNENSYYFLRLPHKVSGIVKKRPSEFPSIEGQMFNENLELRWKKNQKGYQVLVLTKADFIHDFIPVGTDFSYYLYLLAIAQLLNDKYLKLFSFYFHTLSHKHRKTWETKTRSVVSYGKKEIETRFPRKFKIECYNDNIDIAQRYFIDVQTATVHFIALTVAFKKKNA